MAKSNFAHALGEVLKHEGGYADHPSDPGGATNMGITHKTLAKWRSVSPWWNLSKSAIKALTVNDVTPIYRKNYWDAVRGDDLPDGLDLALFDFAVNSGPGRAAITLQTILGVAADGKIGPLTLAAVDKHPAASLVNELCSHRLAFLERLSTFAVFGRGWVLRVSAVRAEALSMAKSPPAAPASQAPHPPPEAVPQSGVAGFAILAAVILGVAAFFIAKATGAIQ